MASANGYLNIVKLLVERNIDVNLQNDSGNTALRKK